MYNDLLFLYRSTITSPIFCGVSSYTLHISIPLCKSTLVNKWCLDSWLTPLGTPLVRPLPQRSRIWNRSSYFVRGIVSSLTTSHVLLYITFIIHLHMHSIVIYDWSYVADCVIARTDSAARCRVGIDYWNASRGLVARPPVAFSVPHAEFFIERYGTRARSAM